MSIINIFYAFCSGAFAAMIGSLGAFVFTGFLCIISIAALFGGADSSFMIFNITFGPYLAPAVSFAGGAAALHYARKRGYMAYGEGKAISKALIALNKPDVIVFGGVIGAVGYVINTLLGQVGFGAVTDTAATTIVIIALVLKLVFDGTLMGKMDDNSKKLGRYHADAACWQPAMTKPFDKALYGTILGGLSACCVSQILASGNEAFAAYGIYLPFGISIIVLLLCMFGVEAPATHHITLCAAYCMAVGGGNIGWGIIAGIIATYMGDFMSRTFCVHGDCHVDPPSMAICTTTVLVQWLLPKTGIYQVAPNVLPYAIIAVVLVATLVMQNSGNKKAAVKA